MPILAQDWFESWVIIYKIFLARQKFYQWASNSFIIGIILGLDWQLSINLKNILTNPCLLQYHYFKHFSIGFRWKFSDVVDMDLIKDRAFINTCLGMSFVFASDFTFSSLLPLMMTKYGYTQSDAALAITVGATAELVSKILLSIFTLFVDARPKTLFFFAMICMALTKIGEQIIICK